MNGEWVTMASVTENGIETTKSDGTLRVLLNTEDCFVIQTKQDGKWVTVTQANITGITAGMLTTLNSQYFGTIGGQYAQGDNGFVLYIKPRVGLPEIIAKLVYEIGNDTAVLNSPKDLIISSPNIIFADENGDKISSLRSISPRGGRILLKNGLVVGVEDGGYSGQVVLDNGKHLTFTDGCLTSVT